MSTASGEIQAEAWRFFLSMYLTPERRSVSMCYRMTQQFATISGLKSPLPSIRRFRKELKGLIAGGTPA